MSEPLLLSYQVSPTAPARCTKCGWTGNALTVHPILEAMRRLQPGEEIPLGDCPKCGQFVYRGTGHGPPCDYTWKLLGDVVTIEAHVRCGRDQQAKTFLVAKVLGIDGPNPDVQTLAPLGVTSVREIRRLVAELAGKSKPQPQPQARNYGDPD
jgi:hypothetical protein